MFSPLLVQWCSLSFTGSHLCFHLHPYLRLVVLLTFTSYSPEISGLSFYYVLFQQTNHFLFGSHHLFSSFVSISVLQVLDDGSVTDTFSHKSQFPKDMDPLSVSGTLQPDGTLLVSTSRTGPEPPGVVTDCGLAHLWYMPLKISQLLLLCIFFFFLLLTGFFILSYWYEMAIFLI